jgi:hypothetical protein
MASWPGPVVNTFWWRVGLSFEVPIDQLPVTLLNRPSRLFAGLIATFGGSLVTIVLWVGVMIAREEGGVTGGAVAAWAVSVLLFGPILLVGINLFVRRDLVIIDSSGVRWEERTLFRTTRREADIREYGGILFRSVVQRDDDGDHEVDVLEMAHADPAHSVRLLKASRGKPLAERWRAYCRRLGLPAVQDVTPRLRIARNLDHLETPLMHLVRMGQIALPDITPMPPAGVEVDAGPGRLVVTLRGRPAVVVTNRQLFDQRVGASRLVREVAYELDEIDALTVETNPWTKDWSIVMSVRDAVGGSRGRRVSLTNDPDLERCLWLHVLLARAIASGAASATPP